MFLSNFGPSNERGRDVVGDRGRHASALRLRDKLLEFAFPCLIVGTGYGWMFAAVNVLLKLTVVSLCFFILHASSENEVQRSQVSRNYSLAW